MPIRLDFFQYDFEVLYAASASCATFVSSSGVNGFGMKLYAPAFVASIAVSIEANHVTITTGTSG